MEVDATVDQTTKITNLVNNAPKLVNVLYPGIVKNVDKALETLGGIRNIESATTGEKKHLELTFRPDNLCSKPALGDRDTVPQVVLKIKTRKTIENGKVIKKEVTDYNVIGITAVNIKFEKLCDFQFLPLLSKETKEYEDDLEFVYNDIMPKKLLDVDWFNSEEISSMPLYFLPFQFSKLNQFGNKLHFDRSKFYEGRFMPQYCDKFKEHQLQQKMLRKDNEAGYTKTTIFLRIEDDIPQEPSPQAMSLMQEKCYSEIIIQKIQKLFEERPIWSRNALFYHTGASLDQMKYILPTLAFHYVSGPWRIMWVRFGFDARVESSSRFLQTFDYRIRGRGGNKIKIRTKRFTAAPENPSDSEPKFSLSKTKMETKPRYAMSENSFVLRPGLLPAARQTYFQYCDVKLPEIENMLGKLPGVLPGSTCDFKHGWLPSGFSDQCREIVNKYVFETMDESRGRRTAESTGKESSESGGDSSSSSDSELSEGENDAGNNMETLEVIDLETVEEINKLLGLKSTPVLPEDWDKPGPSSAP